MSHAWPAGCVRTGWFERLRRRRRRDWASAAGHRRRRGGLAGVGLNTCMHVYTAYDTLIQEEQNAHTYGSLIWSLSKLQRLTKRPYGEGLERRTPWIISKPNSPYYFALCRSMIIYMYICICMSLPEDTRIISTNIETIGTTGCVFLLLPMSKTWKRVLATD